MTSRSRALVALALAASLVGCGSTVQDRSTASAGGTGGNDGLGASSTGSSGAAADEASSTGGSATGGGASSAGGGTVSQGTSGSAPGGSTGTSGSASSSAAAGASTPTSVDGIPAKGPGWDAKTVYIGVTTQQDVQSVAAAAGISSVDSGNQKADVEANLKHVNRLGGLFGRQLKGVYYDVKSAGNADTQAQAACSAFTQDTRVIAVYAAALVADTANFRSCLAKAHIPVLAGGSQAFDDQVFTELQGYYNLMPFPSWTPFSSAFVNRLNAQSYFTGWDDTLGAPSKTAPVKTGFLCPDTPVGHRVGALMAKALKAVGHPLVDQTYYTSDGDVTGYVLAFKADGISHVLVCDLGLFVFAEQAETQHYRPRYGVQTFNTPSLFLQGVVAPAQLVGSMGVGFDPTLDTDAQHDPGASAVPAAARCVKIAADDNLSYTQQQRFAHGVLYDTCDIIGLIVAAAQKTHSFSGPDLKRGLGLVGPAFESAVTFKSGLSATVHANPSVTRDLYYDQPCQCYQYRGPRTSIF